MFAEEVKVSIDETFSSSVLALVLVSDVAVEKNKNLADAESKRANVLSAMRRRRGSTRIM